MNNATSLKVVSLLPYTTEVVAALGMEESLVGRSHECDYPEWVKQLPACTQPKFEPDGTSYEIHNRVKGLLQEGLSVYRVDAEKLRELQPDVILTQDHCAACAVPFDEVEQAVVEHLGRDVHIVNVGPSNLEEVFDSFTTIAETLGIPEQGNRLVTQCRNGLEMIRKTATEVGEAKNTVLCTEWLEPLMGCGNWIPELIEKAGGQPVLSEAGKHASFIDWDALFSEDPDYLVLTPCGYPIQKTLDEVDNIRKEEKWRKLSAVKNGRVYVADGNHYFNRSGPRLVESCRILVEILYPTAVRPQLRGDGWVHLDR